MVISGILTDNMYAVRIHAPMHQGKASQRGAQLSAAEKAVGGIVSVYHCFLILSCWTLTLVAMLTNSQPESTAESPRRARQYVIHTVASGDARLSISVWIIKGTPPPSCFLHWLELVSFASPEDRVALHLLLFLCSLFFFLLCFFTKENTVWWGTSTYVFLCYISQPNIFSLSQTPTMADYFEIIARVSVPQCHDPLSNPTSAEAHTHTDTCAHTRAHGRAHSSLVVNEVAGPHIVGIKRGWTTHTPNGSAWTCEIGLTPQWKWVRTAHSSPPGG